MKMISYIIIFILKVLVRLLPILVMIAYLTLIERKVISSIQRRKGPNVVGFFGLLQPFADALKLIIKETILPSIANRFIFLVAPIITLSLSLMAWVVLPLDEGNVLSDVNLSILFIFAISSLGVYGIIISGWSSNSRYAFLGALRSSAQMISYEVSLGLILLVILICVNSINLSKIVEFQNFIWFIVPLFLIFMLFLISALAETNRPPFDLPEAEAELVAGYFVEYSSMSFALFFIGEYGALLVMSVLLGILFLGGWLLGNYLSLGIKTCIIIFIFIWIRAAFPRYRYDQLMRLGWKIFLPLTISLIVFISGILVYFNF